MLLSVVGILPISAASSTVTLNVKSINGENTSVYVNGKYVGDAPYLSQVESGATVKLVCEDDSFIGYMDTNLNTVSENKEYSFILGSSITVYSMCKNKNESKVMVIYRNTNTTKQVLAYSTYSDISKMEAHLASAPSLFGYEFVSWDKTLDEIKGLAAGGETTVIVNPVYATTTEKCLISVTNGTVNGASSASVVIGSEITLSASTTELSDRFAYWVNLNGDIISDKDEFTTFALYDETYRAVYSDSDITTPLSPSTSIKYFYDESEDKIEIFTQRFIPEGATVKANGLLYVKDKEIAESDMTLEKVDGATLCNLSHTVIGVSGYVKNRASCEEFVCLRPYITYEKDGVTSTVYGAKVAAYKNPFERVWINENFDSLSSISTSTLTNNNKFASTTIASLTLESSGSDKYAKTASGGGMVVFSDADLVIPEAELVTISMNITLTSYPTDSASLITFLTTIGSSYTYDFFLKVNSSGKLLGNDYGQIKKPNGETYTMALNTEYNVKVVYNVKAQVYDLYLNGSLISSESFSTDIREADALSVRFHDYNKGAGALLDDLYLSTSSEEAGRVALNTLSNWSATYFSVTTSKNPVYYSVGEDMEFHFDLRNGTNGATCEYIKLEVKTDDAPNAKTVMLDGSTGEATYNVSLEKAGFAYIKATACDADGNAYSGSEVAKVGAGADIFDITASETKPVDFEAFWADNVADLMLTDPEIVEMTQIAQTSKYTAYNVKILAVDDSALYSDGDAHNYVSGILTVPANTSIGSCSIKIILDGYGIKAGAIKYEENTIVFNPIAHSIDANSSSAYYTSYNSGDLKNYGGLYTSGANSDRDSVYFKNMILRDIQALRFVTEYFGASGNGIWNGSSIRVEGGSQGGFRTAALCSLADEAGIEISSAYIDMPWLCDLNAKANGRIYSRFWPEFTYGEMAYYDTVFFGEGIECDVEIRVGLGDDVAPPTGAAAFYNAISANNKTITYVQNREHGSSGTANSSFTVNPDEGIITVYVDEKLADSIPEKGNYVVYVKGSAEDEWQSWDYDSWSIVGYDKYDEYTVCFVSVDKLYGSYSELRRNSSSLNAGELVGIRSYYEGAGKGASVYSVYATSSSGGTSVGNEKYVILEPFVCGEQRIVTPEQFGAYGDGENADHLNIDRAIAYMAANTVEFESEIYLQGNKVNIQRGNVTINGNRAVLCNRYDWAYEELGEGETYNPDTDLTVVNSDLRIYGSPEEYLQNVTICNLEIRCTEIRGESVLYRKAGHSQLESNYTDGLVIRDCRIINPHHENAPTERHVTSVSITNSHNTVFEDNTVINLSYSPQHSGGVWFSADSEDFTRVSTNITVRNNYIERTGHDETLAFFMGAFDGITVENNTIYTHDEAVDNASAHVVGFGVWDCPTTVKNATFAHNKIDAVASRDIVMFSDVENIEIYDNEIIARNNTPSEPILYGIFRITYIEENYTNAGVTVTQKNVKIYNNKVTAYNTKEIPLSYNCGDGFTFTNNEYVCNVVQ